jgi:uncharacterized protein (TIGR03083 family)
MPTSLDFEHHLDTLDRSGARLLAAAEAAGLDAPVPTCPAWSVNDLLAHVTMVHRWAAAHVRGDDPDAMPSDTQISEGVPDLPAFYSEGLALLLAALRAAPADLEAMTFLKDAPPPREFWARRQAHETTIHGVDALAASLGRPPTVAQADIDTPLAADGIDELLRGFFTRGRCKMYVEGEPEWSFVVIPTDADGRWTVRVGEKLTVDEVAGDAPSTLSGTAAALYLALWNRGNEIEANGPIDVVGRWRDAQRIGWT